MSSIRTLTRLVAFGLFLALVATVILQTSWSRGESTAVVIIGALGLLSVIRE